MKFQVSTTTLKATASVLPPKGWNPPPGADRVKALRGKMEKCGIWKIFYVSTKETRKKRFVFWNVCLATLHSIWMEERSALYKFKVNLFSEEFCKKYPAIAVRYPDECERVNTLYRMCFLFLISTKML